LGGRRMQMDRIKGARRRTATQMFGLMFLLLLLASGAIGWSQATQQFTGQVADRTAAVIPGAEVVVHNKATGVDTKTVTTSTGAYTVSYLIPGVYDITVSKEGFSTAKKTDIQLNVAQTSTIDFTLEVGAASQIVTVNASNAQVELSKSDIGEIIDNERVTEMPLDSRTPFGLFDLSPGTHDFSSSQYPRPFDN